MVIVGVVRKMLSLVMTSVISSDKNYVLDPFVSSESISRVTPRLKVFSPKLFFMKDFSL